MQNQSIFPDCLCCGEHLENKHRILDGLFQCPRCKNEHYFLIDYNVTIINKLSEANRSRNSHHYDEAFTLYQLLAKENPNLVEAYWGMFLSVYGIVYVKEDKNTRYIPVIHQFYDEIPNKNKHFLKVIEMTEDKYMKKSYSLECEYITKTWESAKQMIKKTKPVVVKAPEVIVKKPVEPEEITSHIIKPIGKDLTSEYIIDPIIENKINSAEKIYLQTHKFSRACKVFDEILKTDPLAKKARWNKILCSLEVSSFDELNANAKLDNIFEMFEQLMGCLNPKEENIYLHTIETHLFRKLIEASEFDVSLYEFIASWKKASEQNLFSDVLYQEIMKKLSIEGIKSVEFVHQAVLATTKNLSKDDARYIKRYVEIAEKVNKLGFYKDSMTLTQTILVEYPNHVQTNLIQLCAIYKVTELTELHNVMKDMKFVEKLELLLSQGYKSLELFLEVKQAILILIEKQNYKLSIQLIDKYVSLFPNDEKDLLNQSLLEFSNHLIYHEKYKDAEKYINLLIENDVKIPAAHWAKFMIFIKAHTNFEVLMKTGKKDLMKYPDFERAVNCTSENKEYIQFYEIQDRLKQSTPQNSMYKKMTRRNFNHFDDMCKFESVESFVNELFPKMEEEIPNLFKEEQLSVFSIFNRSIVILLIVSFSFIISQMKLLFDPTESADSLVVSYNIFLTFKNIIILYLVPGFVFISLVVWIREKETLKKGIIGGFIFGLITSIIYLIVLGAIPWAIARFLLAILFSLPQMILSLALSLVSIIISTILLIRSHKKLKKEKVNKKFIKASIVNIIILLFILLLGLLFSGMSSSI
jgi:hypothetical protein